MDYLDKKFSQARKWPEEGWLDFRSWDVADYADKVSFHRDFTEMMTRDIVIVSSSGKRLPQTPVTEGFVFV